MSYDARPRFTRKAMPIYFPRHAHAMTAGSFCNATISAEEEHAEKDAI